MGGSGVGNATYPVLLENSGDNCRKLVLSFHHVAPGDQNWVVKPGSQRPCPLNHLVSSVFILCVWVFGCVCTLLVCLLLIQQGRLDPVEQELQL